MSIIRTVKNTNYTTISNVILNDDRLSWKARGIAAFLLSKPDDWRVNYEHLVKSSPDGRRAVLTAMKELETFGYLTRTKYQTEDGRWRSEVVLHETPSPSVENAHPATGEKPSARKPTVGKPAVGKPTVGKRAPILTPENQSLKPIPEDQSLTPPTPQRGARGEGRETASITEGGEGRREEPDAAPRQPLTAEQLELKQELLDAGLSDQKAYNAAKNYPEDFVRGWLAATLDDLDAGKVDSIGVLVWRLQQGRKPPERYRSRAPDYSIDAMHAAQQEYERRRGA